MENMTIQDYIQMMSEEIKHIISQIDICIEHKKYNNRTIGDIKYSRNSLSRILDIILNNIDTNTYNHESLNILLTIFESFTRNCEAINEIYIGDKLLRNIMERIDIMYLELYEIVTAI